MGVDQGPLGGSDSGTLISPSVSDFISIECRRQGGLLSPLHPRESPTLRLAHARMVDKIRCPLDLRISQIQAGKGWCYPMKLRRLRFGRDDVRLLAGSHSDTNCTRQRQLHSSLMLWRGAPLRALVRSWPVNGGITKARFGCSDSTSSMSVCAPDFMSRECKRSDGILIPLLSQKLQLPLSCGITPFAPLRAQVRSRHAKLGVTQARLGGSASTRVTCVSDFRFAGMKLISAECPIPGEILIGAHPQASRGEDP
jgi:hypothetical protein